MVYVAMFQKKKIAQLLSGEGTVFSKVILIYLEFRNNRKMAFLNDLHNTPFRFVWFWCYLNYSGMKQNAEKGGSCCVNFLSIVRYQNVRIFQTQRYLYFAILDPSHPSS